MRKLALLSLLLMAAVAPAQFSSKELLVTKKVFTVLRAEVRQELKITEDQNTKIQNLFGDSLRVEGDKFMLMMTPDLDLDQIDKDAQKLLTADQAKRLHELWIQTHNGTALADDGLAKDLSLTDEQKKKIEKLVEEAARQLSELFGGGHDEEAAKKSKDIRDKAGKLMLETLTEEQKKKYDELKGKEFKFKQIGG